jgi:predicted nucleotidyltransferase
MGIEELIGRRREEILRIAGQHGARNVRVFGSVARGDAKATSDLDLLIEAGPNLTPWFPGGLSELEELLGRHVDIVTEQALHPPKRDRVLREAIPL